jgi:hypothetical protein
MVHIISYDLHNPGRDYESVAAAIMAIGSWAHPQGSVWFLDTTRTPSEVRDTAKAAGDPNDEMFLARMNQYWASSNMDADVVQWLESPARTW